MFLPGLPGSLKLRVCLEYSLLFQRNSSGRLFPYSLLKPFHLFLLNLNGLYFFWFLAEKKLSRLFSKLPENSFFLFIAYGLLGRTYRKSLTYKSVFSKNPNQARDKGHTLKGGLLPFLLHFSLPPDPGLFFPLLVFRPLQLPALFL